MHPQFFIDPEGLNYDSSFIGTISNAGGPRKKKVRLGYKLVQREAASFFHALETQRD